MGRKRSRARVLGPYLERGGWRVIAITAEGERTPSLCETEAEALELADALRAELATKDATVAEAMDIYLQWKQTDGDRPLKASSVTTLRHRLKAMFADQMDVTVGHLTPRACQAAYDALRDKPRQAVDTHRNTLAAAKAFLEWASANGYASGNPMAGVVGKGARSTGKEQLRTDEAKTLLDTGVELAKKGDLGALAAITTLIVAIRASECAAIVSRDVDDGGRVLVIPRGKTKASARRMRMYPWLGRLLKMAADEDGRVFPGRDRHWVLYHVKRICRLAGVPEVTAHGLRGTHATIGIDGGASAETVAATLGHTHVRITQRHYTKQEATDGARGRKALAALAGKRKRGGQAKPSEGTDA